MKKKTSRKCYCNDFCSPFFLKSGEAEISHKAKKDNPMGFLAGNGKTVSRRARGFIWELTWPSPKGSLSGIC